MTPSLFAGTDAPDEYSLWSLSLDDVKIRQRLDKHRREFITKKDFEWLARQGMNAVRIPVGYWIFGDELPIVPHEPYDPAIEYLDRAFQWAEATGIKVVVSLHGAPGSQNGEMHSGRQGKADWHTDPANVQQTLAVVQKLAERYAGSPALLGISLLNEPAKNIPRKILKQYYKQAYILVRKACGPQVWVIINDIYHPRRWNWSVRWPLHKGVCFDTHQYQIYKSWQKSMSLGSHIWWTRSVVRGLLAWLRMHHPVVVGEWSAALDARSMADVPKAGISQAYTAYLKAQLRVYEAQDGWFYWSYKTEATQFDSFDPWNFRMLREQGVFPAKSEMR